MSSCPGAATEDLTSNLCANRSCLGSHRRARLESATRRKRVRESSRDRGPTEVRRRIESESMPAGLTSILIVDDEIHRDDPLVQLLTLGGFAIECAGTVSVALARVAATPFDAIVLDVRLPDANGLTLLDSLRHKGIESPVVVITGSYFAAEHEAVARRLGAFDFKRKPLDAEELASTLKGAIQQRSNRSRIVSRTIPDSLDVQTTIGQASFPIAVKNVDSGEPHTLKEAVVDNETAIEHVLKEIPTLERKLRRAFPRALEDQITDAVEDAVLEYLADSSGAQSLRRELFGARMYQASWRNLANLLDVERRRRSRETKYAKLIPTAYTPHPEAELPVEQRDATTTLKFAVSDPERAALRLWLGGERRSAPLASALGLSHLAPSAQRQEVKRFKDRLLKRFARAR